MKQELEQLLFDGIDFASAELPLLAHEIIEFYSWWYVVEAGLFLLIAAAMTVAAKKVFLPWMQDGFIGDCKDLTGFCGVLFTILSWVTALICVTANTRALIVLHNYPRLWFVEYAAKIVSS